MTPVELKALIFMIKQGSYIEAKNLGDSARVKVSVITDKGLQNLMNDIEDYRKYTRREAEAAMDELFDEVRKIEKP